MKDNKQYDNYIFDLYWTLINNHTNEDSPKLWRDLSRLYKSQGFAYEPKELHEAYLAEVKLMQQEIIEKFAKKGIHIQYPEHLIEDTFKRLALKKNPKKKVSDDWCSLMANDFRLLSRDRLQLFPGTKAMLGRLKKAGKKVYLLSNAQAVFTRGEFELMGLPKYFDGVFYSSDLEVRKPEPYFMQRLLEEYHLDPKTCVMIGNEVESDVKIADACGVDAILVNANGHTDKEIAERKKKYGIKQDFAVVQKIAEVF